MTFGLSTGDDLRERVAIAAGRGRAAYQVCVACGHTVYFPRVYCPYCWSADLRWEETATGTIESWCVVHRPQRNDFQAWLPIVFVAVRLDAGPIVMSHLVNCEPREVVDGMPVVGVEQGQATEIGLPVFEPARPSSFVPGKGE